MAMMEAGRLRDPRAIGLKDLIGESPGMVLLRQQIIHLISRQSASRRLPTLLLQGETGTGKGLLARAVHNASARSSQPFIDADCVALPENLLEAELFGFERGAFTDAKQAKLGLFHAASGGSIFLDEVGLLPRTFQAKLLKVVEERGVRRLGSTQVDVLDVWVITATNVDLATATREGNFREDLYHRLAAMTLFLPPLRERGGDILLLAEHYLGRACAEYRLPPKVLTEEAQAALLAYAWPGNVRELANMLERVALLSGDMAIITPDLLGLHQPAGPTKEVREAERSQLRVSVEGFEREKLRATLRETGWNISLAAARLGVPRNTLRYRIARLDLHPGKTGPVTAPGRKPPAKLRERATTAGPGGHAWTDGAWQPRRGVYLAAAVAQAGADPGRLSRILEGVADTVRRFGGRIEAMHGSELLSSFGVADALEDGPSCAANAALAVQKAGTQGYPDGSGPFTARLTIHASGAPRRDGDGTAETTGERQGTPGPAVGVALDGAEPESILVAADAAHWLPAQYDLEPVAAPPGAGGVPRYRLVGRRQAGSGASSERLAPFMGREYELAMLDALLDEVVQGRGRAAGIVGEAGIGKSRLLREFRERALQRGVIYRGVECVPSNGAVVSDAMTQILQQTYGIADGDSDAVIYEKVRHGMEDTGLDPDEWAPYLLIAAGVSAGTERLAGLGRDTIRARTMDMLRRFAVEMRRRAPLVIAVAA